MKQESQVLVRNASSRRGLQEGSAPDPGKPPRWLPRLTLGGALCGGFAGSIAGALLGAAIGAVFSDVSLGLDGALIGSALAVPAGAAYGLVVALREKRHDDETSGGRQSPVGAEIEA